jgi:hypothetical protein
MENLMRLTFALTLAAGVVGVGMACAPEPAEAKDDYYRYRGRTYRVTKACDHTCIRARSLDPAGTYQAYPDWARAALSPKTDGRRR